MAASSRPPGRVGARHRAKLKKWSDKVAREGRTPGDAPAVKQPLVRRARPLEAARKKLRTLLH
jgi:hypothetical protein